MGSTLIAHLWSPHVTELAKAAGSDGARPGYLLGELVWGQNNMPPCWLPCETDAVHPIWSGQNHIRISLSVWALCALSLEDPPPIPPTQCNQCLSHNNSITTPACRLPQRQTLKNVSTPSSTVFTSNQSFEESDIIGGTIRVDGRGKRESLKLLAQKKEKIGLIQRPSCTAWIAPWDSTVGHSGHGTPVQEHTHTHTLYAY